MIKPVLIGMLFGAFVLLKNEAHAETDELISASSVCLVDHSECTMFSVALTRDELAERFAARGISWDWILENNDLLPKFDGLEKIPAWTMFKT